MNRLTYHLISLAVLGMCELVCVDGVGAAPIFPQFLKVDLNGTGVIGNGEPGEAPTAPGFQGWDFPDPLYPPSLPDGSSIVNSFGDVTVRITFHVPVGNYAGTRDRGWPETAPTRELYRDFIFVPRTDREAGVNRFTYEFSGLSANTRYEFTFWSYDDNHIGTLNQMAYSLESPLETYPNGYLPFVGAVPEPCRICGPHPPTEAFSVLGGNGVNGSLGDGTGPPTTPYDYSASFVATSDASGKVTIYSWNASPVYVDGSSEASNLYYQYAGVVNGFAIGNVPEPSTFALLALGTLIAAVTRRRRIVRQAP